MSKSTKNFIIVILAFVLVFALLPSLRNVLPEFNDENTTEEDSSSFETTKSPDTTADPDSETTTEEETTEAPKELGNWRIVVSEYAYCFEEDFSDKTSIKSVYTNNINGNTLCCDGTYYSAITANRILLGNSFAAVEGFEISGMNAKIYAADGTLLDIVKVFIGVNGDASALGFENTVMYLVYDNDYIDLTAYAGQTVTVIYEVALVDSEHTVEVISIDVTVPSTPEETTAAPEETTAAPEETTAAPEETTAAPGETTATPEDTTEAPIVDVFALEPGLYSSELNTTTPVISWDSLVEQGAVIVTDGAVTPGANLPAGNLILPNDGSVTTIGYKAFVNCEGLTGILIPDAVTTIAFEAFLYCTDLEAVVLGNGVETISDTAFSGCTNLQRVYFGAGVKSFGTGVFNGCTSLAEIHVDDLAAFCEISCSDNSSPFFKNNFTTLYVDGQAVTDLVIPDSVTKIGNYLFAYCRTIKSLEIGSNITSIGVYAFDSCLALETVKMSSGSFSLGLFNGCNAKTFDFSGCTSVLAVPSPYYPPFTGTSTIYVPADLYDEWIAAEHWSDIADRIVAK